MSKRPTSFAGPFVGQPARPLLRPPRVGRAVRVVALLGIGAVMLGACSSGPSTATGSPGTKTAAGGGHVIVIENYAFSPSQLTVKPGTRITVENHDSVTHTLTSTQHRFDTGNINPGASATITAPNTSGSYPYMCAIHPFMTGALVVSSSA